MTTEMDSGSLTNSSNVEAVSRVRCSGSGRDSELEGAEVRVASGSILRNVLEGDGRCGEEDADAESSSALTRFVAVRKKSNESKTTMLDFEMAVRRAKYILKIDFSVLLLVMRCCYATFFFACVVSARL